MARLLYCDPGSLLVYKRVGSDLRAAVGEVATFYQDAAGMVLADMAEYDPLNPNTPGPVIASSQLTVDTYSLIPWFWGPVSGLDTLYTTVNGGPLTRITAYYDPRIDAIATSAAGAIQSSLVDAKGDLLVGTANDTVARLAVGTAGYVPTADPAAASGLAYYPRDPNAYTTGTYTNDRTVPASSRTLGSQVCYFTYFTATRAETISQVATFCLTAAGATPTLCRMGIYSVDGSGNLTQVGACANDTTLWSVGNTRYIRSLSASYAQVQGQRYAVGSLCVTGASLASLAAAAPFNNGNGAAILALAPRLSGLVSGQSDLPSSVAVGSLSTIGAVIFAEVLP